MKYDTMVFIGRFQPLHIGHEAVIRKALSMAKEVVIVVGSAFQSRDIRNPFTFKERADIIREVFPNDNLHIVPAQDFPYDDNRWIKGIQQAVESFTKNKNVALIGHEKDGTSYYLKLFPYWKSESVTNIDGINATDIRDTLFMGKGIMPTTLSTPVQNLFRKPHNPYARVLDDLSYEKKLIDGYKESWEAAPYPPTFVTTDAVVIQSGHVLLVQRGHSPGIGLLALPGGFLNQGEKIVDGMIRELREETRLKVPDPVLRGSIVDQAVFDDPMRSTRGRTITHAFHIELEPMMKLPKIKGSDDAVDAKWVPLADVDPEQMFEDHAHIIDYFVGG